MSEAIVREIAQQIIKEQFLQNWVYYILFLLLTLLLSSASAWMMSYVRKRGENFATKADFENLLSQMREKTKTTEEVKTAISYADWTTKEWKTLRRLKLEELLESVYSTRLWIDKEHAEHFYEGKTNEEKCPVYKMSQISLLYFPEFKLEALELNLLFSEYMSWTFGTKSKLFVTKENPTQRSVVWESLNSEMLEYHERLLNSIKAFESKASEIMKG